MDDDRLWSARELAKYLGYSQSTVARMVSQEPAKLPPRVFALSRPRWEPAVVREWVRNGGGSKRS